MISFYPGPSQVYPEVPQFVKDAYEAGLLSANHRSQEFVEVSMNTLRLLREKLNIPEDYSIFFASSATECWEIISQSLVKTGSCHFYNGAFGEKWYHYALKLQPNAMAYPFTLEQALPLPDETLPDWAELIAVTHNETSNGTAVDRRILATIKKQYPDKLLAVDATSSMAGAALDFLLADVWYASVQKCFGLPAGMAVLICSPQAMDHAAKIGERNHYNSLLYLQDMMQKYQTTYTPNVLNIYLLMRIMDMRPDIRVTEQKLKQRFGQLRQCIAKLSDVRLLVQDEGLCSLTVIPFMAKKHKIDELRSLAKEQGMVLGNGYGKWKETSLRIANFPALSDANILRLQQFLLTQPS